MIDEKKLIEEIEEEASRDKLGLSKYIPIRAIKEMVESQPKIGKWISCSERLPTMEECQKNDCRFILDDGNRRYQGLFDYIEKRFIWFNCEGTHTDKCVIAWQPLPAPYEVKSDE